MEPTLGFELRTCCLRISLVVSADVRRCPPMSADVGARARITAIERMIVRECPPALLPSVASIDTKKGTVRRAPSR